MPILFNFIVITQIGSKKLEGHHACLGDIVQILLKWASFAHFPREA